MKKYYCVFDDNSFMYFERENDLLACDHAFKIAEILGFISVRVWFEKSDSKKSLVANLKISR